MVRGPPSKRLARPAGSSSHRMMKQFCKQHATNSSKVYLQFQSCNAPPFECMHSLQMQCNVVTEGGDCPAVSNPSLPMKA